VSDDFLSRWSRRKIEARKQDQGAIPAQAQTPPEAQEPLPPLEEPPGTPEPLPSIESLTPESDFAPFMKAEVDPQLKRDALKALFKDPRYNVMDGLDVYIDDYSKPDPLPAGWLEQMTQFARLGDYKPPVDEPAGSPPESGPGDLKIESEQILEAENGPRLNGAPESELPPPESKNS